MFPVRYDGVLAHRLANHRHLARMGSDRPGGQCEDNACTEGVLLRWLSKTCRVQITVGGEGQLGLYEVRCAGHQPVYNADILGEALVSALLALWDMGIRTPLPEKRR